jgi:hypothetical protein
MGKILSKDALLGASDLVEREVDLNPWIDGSVTVRSLPAAYSNQAMSEALEMVTATNGTQTARVNTVKLEELQVLHGLVDPKLDTVEEVRSFSEQCGPSWRKVVTTIDEISGVNKAAIEKAHATFPAGGSKTGLPASNGTPPDGGGPDIRDAAGGTAAQEREGDR